MKGNDDPFQKIIPKVIDFLERLDWEMVVFKKIDNFVGWAVHGSVRN